jgi:putative ABC transport system permease protein
MKRLTAAMRIAFRALEVNKLRSALTMLGIVIGVAAVIATAAIGSGAKQRIQQQIASIGSNTIIILPGSLTSSGMRMGSGNAVTLSESDARELPTCPDISRAVPIVRGGAQVVYGNNNWATIIYGTTPGYLEVRDLSVASGSAFSQQDVDSANKVALLGETVVSSLFGDIDPVGQSIRIKNMPFTVVGVLETKGQSPTGQDQDDVILLPISTAKRKVIGTKSANADAVDSITMQAKSSNQIQAAQDEAEALLRQRHHLLPSEEDDFSVRNMEEIFAAQETSFSHIMSLMLAAVASVSLIVGGIGIMNIMLVSVRERTREIGLRQAVGAKTRDILTQFLVEAATLSIAGGCAGIILGIAASAVVSRLANWNTVSMGAVTLAVSSLLWWASASGITRHGRPPISILLKLRALNNKTGRMSDHPRWTPLVDAAENSL